MPGRKFSGGSEYRYGFNGKELDKEVAGTTTYDYGFRIYNPGLGRFLSVDPLTKSFPWNSTYAFAENDVIRNVDLDGEERKHFMLVWNDNHNIATLKYSHESDFTVTTTDWTPTWSDWFKSTTTTVKNPRIEYVVHGTVSVPMSADGMFADEVQEVTWTFKTADKMFYAEKHRAKTVDGKSEYSDKWFYASTDQKWDIAMLQSATYSIEAAGTKQIYNPGGSVSVQIKPRSTFLGGDKGSLYSKQNILEGNHAPTMKSFEIAGFKVTYNQGSAFQMLYEEHRSFISTGNSKAAQAFRNQEAALLKQGKFMEAFELTAERVNALYGNKYSTAIQQAREYYKNTIVPALQQQLSQKVTTPQ